MQIIQINIAVISLILLTGCSFKSGYKAYQDKGSGYKSNQSYSDSELASRPSSSFKYNLQPYTINGKTYTPTFVNVGEEFDGIASWYGPDFNGKKTANGEIYDMYAMTAAHKTLPINTIVKVINQKNQKVTTVRINDRGPFVEGRIIDLSFSAGKEIGLDKTGTAPVKLIVLGFDGKIDATGKTQMPVQLANFGVQIGAFKNKTAAENLASSTVEGQYRAVVKSYNGDGQGLYRVILSGFNSLDEARDFAKNGKYQGAFAISLDQ